MLRRPLSRSALRGILLVYVFPIFTLAQLVTPPSRITQAVDELNVTVLRGNTHPLAQTRFDQGAAPDPLTLRRMLLVLKRSPVQDGALATLLDDQQNITSANYHHRLTPQEFGRQFGPADQDIQTIVSWLQARGFTVAGVSNGRTVIEFSGTAGQVRQSFHIEIHRYTQNGQDHWANASDPQIPAALAPVVAGINTLYNFPRQPMHEVIGHFSRSRETGQIQSTGSQFTAPFDNGRYVAVAPADFAKIYNVPNLVLSPVPATAFNGDGQKIAIIGESDINPQDVTQFRALFGLPTPPKLNTIVDGPDPGIVDGDETEGDLDVEWAGAVAPNAAIDYVIAQSTEVSLGVDLAAQYAVDNNLAPVLNESYGNCEFFMGNANNTFYNQLWQQAAAEGITVTVSSGDGGSAACDQNAGTHGPASYGLTVSGFTSTPYNVSVGGTDFNDGASFSTYWNTTLSDTPALASALGYIPEITWNDTCTNQEIFARFAVNSAESSCNNATESSDGLVSIIGGSGGASNCTQSDGVHQSSCSGGYAKPSWQSGTGVPSDGQRDIPDVSLFASNGFNASFYVVCEQDANFGAPSCDPFTGFSDFIGVGGTSASSPAFAAIMALVDQATGSRQGNANYILYKLASESGNTCASVPGASAPCVFYDVPTGSTIQVPCVTGSLNCNTTVDTDPTGVLAGYATTTGYDLATGLGSVNAGNLISRWTSFASGLEPSKTTFSLNGGATVSITHGQSVAVAISVANDAGTGTPTGTVSLIANSANGALQTVGSASLVNGAASFNTLALPGGANYSVFAQYSGDAAFAPSNSGTSSVTVEPEESKVSIAYELFDANGNQTSPNSETAGFGQFSLLRLNVASRAGDACAQNVPGSYGCPTGTLTLTDNGNPLDGGLFSLNSQGYADDDVISLAAGTHQITAAYPGDSSYTGSSGTNILTISKANTNVTISANSTTWNGTVYLSVTIATSSYATNPETLPTGSVQIIMDGNTTFASQLPLFANVNGQNGTAQATTGVEFGSGLTPVGHHTFVAQYSGDANYAQGASNVLSITSSDTTYTNVTFASGGQDSANVVVTAGLRWADWAYTYPSGNIPTPTGTIQFNLSSATGTSLGTAAISNAQAQVVLPALSIPAGSTIYATYSGDANFSPSTGSGTMSSLLLNTAITLTSSSPSSVAGNLVNFTAQLSPAPGGPVPTGTITFYAASPYGTSVSDVKLVSNNQAQGALSFWSGADQVLATYSGDANYATSIAIVVENVTPISTATTVTSLTPSVRVGDVVTLGATVRATGGGSPAPNGGVYFYADGTPLGNAGVTNGQTALAIQNLAAGTYSIIANYGGDFYHSASSASTTQTITRGPSSTVATSSSPTITQGSVVTLTAQVSRANSVSPAPTGAVQFSANGKALAITPVSAETGTAQFIIGSLPEGTMTVIATYSGDSNYIGSAGTFTQTVNPAATPAFSISATPVSLTIAAPGQSASTTLAITSQGGFAGAGGLVGANCGILAVDEITCSLSSFTLPANGTVQATLTFTSTAASQSAANLLERRSAPLLNLRGALDLALAGLAFFASLRHRKDRRWNWSVEAVLIAILVTCVGCGSDGSGKSSGNAGPPNPGTPAGMVQPLNVLVSVDGVTQPVPNLTVTVQ